MTFRGLLLFLTLSSALWAQLPTKAPGGNGANSAAAAAAANANKSPGSVYGKVTDSVTGQPIKRAVVSLRNGAGGFSYQALTDSSGRFQFDTVEPGDTYFATASCQGYQVPLGGRGATKVISVKEREQVKDVSVLLAPFGAVSGKITDRDGEPVQNANIMALRYTYDAGTKRLGQFQGTSTNDKGEFRIEGLQPGRYYFVATARPIQAPATTPQTRVHSTISEEAYQPVFYPSGSEASQAQATEVKAGAELSGIDFRMTKAPAFHIRGSIRGMDEKAPAGRGGIQVRRCEGDEPSIPNDNLPVRMTQGTAFDISGATPGAYCLTEGLNGQQNMPYGSTTVQVRDRDVEGVTIDVAPGFDVAGTVTIEGTPPATPPRLTISLRSMDMNGPMPRVVANPDVPFTLKNVFARAYALQIPAPQNLYIKSIHLGSQDVSDGKITPVSGAMLSVALGTDPGGVDGTVQLGGDPAPGISTVVYSTTFPARNDLIRNSVTGQNGSFSTSGLAPGTYKVLAVDTQDFNELSNPDLRAALDSKAASVTIQAGGRQTVQVRAVSADELAQARGKIR